MHPPCRVDRHRDPGGAAHPLHLSWSGEQAGQVTWTRFGGFDAEQGELAGRGQRHSGTSSKALFNSEESREDVSSALRAYSAFSFSSAALTPS